LTADIFYGHWTDPNSTVCIR